MCGLNTFDNYMCSQNIFCLWLYTVNVGSRVDVLCALRSRQPQRLETAWSVTNSMNNKIIFCCYRGPRCRFQHWRQNVRRPLKNLSRVTRTFIYLFFFFECLQMFLWWILNSEQCEGALASTTIYVFFFLCTLGVHMISICKCDLIFVNIENFLPMILYMKKISIKLLEEISKLKTSWFFTFPNSKILIDYRWLCI